MVGGGEGDGQLWGRTWCHCSVLWLVGEGDDQLLGSRRGAIAGCHCSVLWWGEGRVTANFGGGRGAIVVCYGWWGRVTTNFWEVDVVPLQGAIVVCYGGGRGG